MDPNLDTFLAVLVFISSDVGARWQWPTPPGPVILYLAPPNAAKVILVRHIHKHDDGSDLASATSRWRPSSSLDSSRISDGFVQIAKGQLDLDLEGNIVSLGKG